MARFEDYDNEYYDHRKSSGVAKAGLTTGIVGSSLAGLLSLGAMNGAKNGNHCNEEILVNRYEAQKEHDIMTLTTENAMLKGEKDTDRKLLELFKYFNGKTENINQALASQAVQNQRNADSFTMVRNLVEEEARARCCADNTIVNYANNTFYPQEIANIKTENTSTTKRIYNPLPGERCDNGCG